MMRSKVVQDDNNPLLRIPLPNPSEECAYILFSGMFVKIDHRHSIECIEPEGIGPYFCRVLRDGRSCERPEPLAVRGGLRGSLIQKTNHRVFVNRV